MNNKKERRRERQMHTWNNRTLKIVNMLCTDECETCRTFTAASDFIQEVGRREAAGEEHMKLLLLWKLYMRSWLINVAGNSMRSESWCPRRLKLKQHNSNNGSDWPEFALTDGKLEMYHSSLIADSSASSFSSFCWGFFLPPKIPKWMHESMQKIKLNQLLMQTLKLESHGFRRDRMNSDLNWLWRIKQEDFCGFGKLLVVLNLYSSNVTQE